MQKISVDIPVSFFKEGASFIAYAPALDLSTCGKTFALAKKRFAEASAIFFEELQKSGNFNQVLTDLGWRKSKESWQPALPIAHEVQRFNIPTLT